MTHGTDGKVFDRLSHTWVSPEEMQRRKWDREEAAFQRQPNQGELTCPMVIRDTMDPIKSMLDGQMYDSKSNLRRTYRQGGVEEVGNDSSIMEPKPRKRRKPDEKGIRASVARAISQANLTTSSPGDHVKIKDVKPWGPPNLYTTPEK